MEYLSFVPPYKYQLRIAVSAVIYHFRLFLLHKVPAFLSRGIVIGKDQFLKFLITGYGVRICLHFPRYGSLRDKILYLAAAVTVLHPVQVENFLCGQLLILLVRLQIL